jgi:hypothetical protein
MRYASRLILFAAISTAIGTGCGDDGGNAEVAGSDTGSGDAAADTGPGSADTLDDTGLADTLDDSGSGSADTGADTAVDTVDDDAWMAACPEPPQGDQPLAGRWSLSLFHFNIQYVAGGTTGFAEIAANAPASSRLLDMTEQETEDRIVTESIVPLLEILDACAERGITMLSGPVSPRSLRAKSRAAFIAMVMESVPPEVIAKINRDFAAILAEPALKERLSKLGFTLVGGEPKALADHLSADIAKWAKVASSPEFAVK